MSFLFLRVIKWLLLESQLLMLRCVTLRLLWIVLKYCACIVLLKCLSICLVTCLSPNWTRSPAVAMVADRTGCQWPSRSSKVDDFHVNWKPICDFLSMINSNLGPILHHLATVHPWRTDGRMTTMPIARPLLKYGRLKTNGSRSLKRILT